MKVNASRRLLAVIIALLMVVQLLPPTLMVSASEANTVTYTFDATKDVTLGSADKEAIAEGTTYADGYFTVVGKVTQRTDGDVTKVKSIELAKKAEGAIAFTVTGTATVTIGASSTGGSNTSIIALLDGEGNEIGRNEVTGTSFMDVTYSDLAAGTYQIVCPDTERNTRVETITVVETLAAGEEGGDEPEQEPVTKTYTFDATKDVTLGSADKEAIAEGTTYADGYFTVVGMITQRTDGDVTKVKSIELAKKSEGAIAFTVTGTATVTIGASSTGGSNTSIIALLDGEGNEIGRNEVTGTTFVDVTYSDLAAGTYQIVCPDTERNTRVETITVVETLAADEEPEQEPVTLWDFTLDEYVAGQTEYNGLVISSSTNAPGKNTSGYGLSLKNSVISVPVSGPCTVVVSVGYQWDVTFPDGTNEAVTSGDGGKITVSYNHTGEAGTVELTIGETCTTYISKIELTELVVEEEPATSWDFSEEAFINGGYTGGSGTYHGLRWTNGKSHNNVYLYSGSGTITVPVSGPCTVVVSACYEYSFYFENETEASVGVSTGSTSQIDTYSYNHTGEAGEVVITVLGGSYITKIELTELVIEDEDDNVPDLEPGKIYVWDFGAEVLEGEQYVNMLTVDEINSWFKNVEPGTTGKNIASFVSSDGLLRFEDGGKPGTHRLRSTNAALTRYDDKSLTDADGNVYTGYIYSNSGSTDAVYVAIMVNAGERVTLVVGSNGGNSMINFESPSGVVAQQEFLSSGAKAQILTFYPTETGEYKIYSTTEKLVLARIYREAPAEVTVTGTVTAPSELTDYAIVFTNTASGVVVTAPVVNGAYTAVLHDGFTYEVSLADANGYIVTSETTLTIPAGAGETGFDITVEAVELITVTGTFEGIAESALANLKLSFQADAIYIPEVTVSGNTYTAKLEKGVTYTVVVEGVNDYVLVSEATVTYSEDTTANITFEAKPTYAVTIDPVGATLADLANATFVFTNLNEEGYVYTFVGTDNIALRDGVYSVKVTGAGNYVQKMTSNLTVNGAAVTKTIEFEVPTAWDFSTEDFDGSSPYNGLVFSNGQKNKTYLLANTGTISVPVSGPCKIVVSACYQYSFYFASQDESSVDQKTGSTSQIDSFAYLYTGEAGFVDITVLGQSYLTRIEIVEVVAYTETITVGASGCDYTTIGAALNAVKAMDRPNNERVTILIQPGNYEEMLVVDVPNVTLKNASDNPSIELTNEGVDIAENAVRITWYYGHGYTYYSMGADCKFDAELLEINKQNGYPSFENPGAGTTNGSYWNATVVISADGFQAEGIIFENSFNQYISAAAANDIIVAQGSAKEGNTPRAELGVYSTAVQDKKYVERAAALAIADNCNEVYFENCKFVGRQDTLYGGKGATVAFYDCAVYGGTDYIFGAMTAVFAKCDLVFNTSEDMNDVGYITAAQQTSGRGYLMYNCTITSTTPGVDTASEYASKPGYYGRPWAANTAEVVFYMTNIEATCSYWYGISASLIRPDGWLSTLSGESAMVGEFGTYEIAEGVDNSANRVSWANVFETEQLADGTPITVEAFLGDWDPFAGKDMTIVMSTEKVNNDPNQEEDDGGDDGQDTPTEEKTYILESADLDPVAAGDKTDGETQLAGTEDFFTIIYGAKTKIDGSKKLFDDGYYSEQRINFQGKTTSEMYYSIKFTTDGPAVIKLWWVSGGDDRQFAIYDENGDIVCMTNEEALKNETYISELTVDAAGTYYIGLPDGSNYLFKAEVTVGTAQDDGEDPENPENPDDPDEPVDPDTPVTGDGIVIVCLVMAFAALALVVLIPNKKRLF